ncbi:retropepsin-like aspartic protease family protein [Thiolapillus sp.]
MMRCITLLFLFTVSAGLFAVERLQVVALFPGKAMFSIDGEKRLLKVGERSPEGVLLVSANSNEAVIEMNGDRQTLALGKGVAARYKAPQATRLRIVLGNDGAYSVQGAINGHSVPMVVDTGANTVALSASQAARIGLDYRRGGQQVLVQTASGVARGYALSLSRVRAGNIELHHVAAVVIEGELPEKVLLGMSFLSRLHIQNKGNLMVLTKSH